MGKSEEEPKPTKAINLLFEQVPDTTTMSFVEAEDDDGKCIRVGEWSIREDGLHVLRITELPKSD